MVSSAENTHDAGFLMMSADTSGSSLYSSTPRYDALFDAARNASLIASLSADLLTVVTRSVIEPTGVGTRSEVPSSLPLRFGSTLPIVLAAPVELGMIDSAAARMRRRSGLPDRDATA